jgi:signal transduction histidine kinase
MSPSEGVLVDARTRDELGRIGVVDAARWARMVWMDTGAPAWRGRPSIADLGIAGASAALGIGGVVAEVLSSGRPPHLVLGGAALAVLAAAGLPWRRRAPLPVALAVIGCCLIYHTVGYPGLAPAVAMYPAAYTVAAYGRGRRLGLALGLIGVVGLIPLLPPLPATYNLGALTGPEIGMVAAAVMGEATRTRWTAAAEQLRSVRRAAAEQQRRRLLEQRLEIAREVHDVLAHTITVITVQAAAASDALDERPHDARAALAQVRRAARDASAELRGTLRLLRGETDRTSALAEDRARDGSPGRPGVVPPQPGLAQLPELARRAGEAGIEVALRVTGDGSGCSAARELAVYRVVQEALTNVVRHSGASLVQVQVELTRDEIRVEVTDDGGEPRPTGAISVTTQGSSRGHGLIGMRERVEAFGGSLEAGLLPTSGFRVLARLPTHSGEQIGHIESLNARDAAPDATPAGRVDPIPGPG